MRRHWHVEGRVQGVFFRQSTMEEARRIGGLRGWVRNLPGGGVEVLAEGEPEPLERLLAFLRRGPPGARVTAVRESDAPAGETLSEFQVSW